MKIEEEAQKLTVIATALAKGTDSECAGAITVNGKKIIVAMAGSDTMTEKRRAEITLAIGKYMTEMGESWKKGKIVKEEVNLDDDQNKWCAN